MGRHPPEKGNAPVGAGAKLHRKPKPTTNLAQRADVTRGLSPRASAVVEVIRTALESLKGDPDEELVLGALWRDLAARRPGLVASLGEEFERNPTEPERDPRRTP